MSRLKLAVWVGLGASLRTDMVKVGVKGYTPSYRCIENKGKKRFKKVSKKKAKG